MSASIDDPLFYIPSLRVSLIRAADALSVARRPILLSTLLLGTTLSLWHWILPTFVWARIPRSFGLELLSELVSGLLVAFFGSVIALAAFDVLRGRSRMSDRTLFRQAFLLLPATCPTLLLYIAYTGLGICFFLLPALLILPTLCMMVHASLFESPSGTESRSRDLTRGYRSQLCGVFTLFAALVGLCLYLKKVLISWLPQSELGFSVLVNGLPYLFLILMLTVYYHDLRWIRGELTNPADDGRESGIDRSSVVSPLENLA